MSPCDSCGQDFDEERTHIHKVTTTDGSVAYICDDCYEQFSDDPGSVF